VNIDSATREGLTCREGAGVRPLRDHSETPCGASIEQKFAALGVSSLGRRGVLNHVLVDHVDGTFFCLEDVFESIFRIAGSSGETNNDDRGIMVDHLSVTERSQICALSICGNSRHKSDRSRNNSRDHNTVVINRILQSDLCSSRKE